MVTFGYAKGYQYNGDGTLSIRVRVPNIHGPYKQSEYGGKTARNYVRDEDLPYYQSILLPHLPNEGDVVALMNTNSSENEWIVVGLTGATYTPGTLLLR